MSNLNITLKLFGGLDKYVKDYNHKKGASLRLDSNQAVSDIAKKIGIPTNRISLVLINNNTATLNCIIKNNDIIKIFPQIGGG